MEEFSLKEGRLVIGLISDTHGLLRPEAADALRGADVILHAGDAGRPEVLAALRNIAPVTAVRGNVDAGDWAKRLPLVERINAGGRVIALVHIIHTFEPKRGEKLDAVVYGHSHMPKTEWKNGIFYVNPGSAGPRRLKLPVSVARLTVTADALLPELVELF